MKTITFQVLVILSNNFCACSNILHLWMAEWWFLVQHFFVYPQGKLKAISICHHWKLLLDCDQVVSWVNIWWMVGQKHFHFPPYFSGSVSIPWIPVHVGLQLHITTTTSLVCSLQCYISIPSLHFGCTIHHVKVACKITSTTWVAREIWLKWQRGQGVESHWDFWCQREQTLRT